MNKRFISEDELNSVIKVRESGASWLRIENETGVPRRLAKKCYEEWERKKSVEELREARIGIAQAEFRNHMDALVGVARYLVDRLHAPTEIAFGGNADRFLEGLWAYYAPQGDPPKNDTDRLRLVRRNRMLFDSLKEHTGEKVPWRLVEEWKDAYALYIDHSRDLVEKADSVTTSLISKRKELNRALKDELLSEYNLMIIDMVRGIIKALGRAIKDGKLIKEDIYIAARVERRQRAVLLFGQDRDGGTPLMDRKLAQRLVDFCSVVARDLSQGKNEKPSLVDQISSDLCRMDAIQKELDETLDELLLRPLILRTRCKLCPA